MRRWIGIVMAVLVAAGAVVALVGGGRDGTPTEGAKSAGESSGTSSVRPAAPTGNASAGSTDAFAGKSVASDAVVGSPVPAPTPGGPPVPGVTPRIARTAELHVRVARKAIGARLGDAEGLAAVMGGYVVRSESGRASRRSPCGCPADRYDETLRRLGAMGKVSAQHAVGHRPHRGVRRPGGAHPEPAGPGGDAAGHHAPGPHGSRHHHGPAAARPRCRSRSSSS